MSIVGEDAMGILVKANTECENANVNVIEASQTLLQDVFVMIVLIDIAEGNTTPANSATHMENVEKQSGSAIHVMCENVFSSIHKIQDGERMMDVHNVLETIKMTNEEYLDVHTIAIGISLLDCRDSDIDKSCEKVYNKITHLAKNLVKTGRDIEQEYGISIISKRISVAPIATPVAVNGGDPVKYVHTLKRYVRAVGINFIDGYSALVQKGCVAGDHELMESIPGTLAETEHVYASVNVGPTKAGINMNAVELMGRMVKEAAGLMKSRNCIGAVKLVVSYNAPEDNPFMTGTFRGIGEANCVINVGVSGPGVVRAVLAETDKSLPMSELAGIIKKTAFGVTRMEQLVGTLTSGCLGVPSNIVGPSLTSTPAIGDSVAYILEGVGLESCGAYGATACLVMLNDAVKRGGITTSNTADGPSDALIPVSEDTGMIVAARAGTLHLEKLGAMAVVYSVGLDMVVTPGEAIPEVTSGVIADEATIGMISSKTIAVRAIPVTDKKVREELESGGLPGSDPMMNINQTDCSIMIHRKGRIPVPIQALKD